MSSAYIYSIFTSIQGEGIYLGVPQIFVRFAGCNLRCKYCDTSEALHIPQMAQIEEMAFSGRFKPRSNPLSVKIVLEAIKRLQKTFTGFHSVSLTGGEPLLQKDFLLEFLPHLKTCGLPIFLETNGTLPDELRCVIKLVDIISLDIKIPSSIRGKLEWEPMEKFLKFAKRKNCYVKVVISKEGEDHEFIKAREIVRKVNPTIPVVIQPASGRHLPSLKRLIMVYRIFRAGLNHVRLIPQVHKFFGWL